MSRLSFPARSGLIIAEAHGEVLHQAMERNRAFGAERPPRGNLFWWKDFEEETQMRPMSSRRRSEILRGPDRHRELGKYVVATWNRERFAGERALASQQGHDCLADTRRMNVAITRARRLLIVVGDSGTLGEHPYYRAFLDRAQAISAWISAWDDDAPPFDRLS